MGSLVLPTTWLATTPSVRSNSCSLFPTRARNTRPFFRCPVCRADVLYIELPQRHPDFARQLMDAPPGRWGSTEGPRLPQSPPTAQPACFSQWSCALPTEAFMPEPDARIACAENGAAAATEAGPLRPMRWSPFVAWPNSRATWGINSIGHREIVDGGAPWSGPIMGARVVQKVAPKWALKARTLTRSGAIGANFRGDADLRVSSWRQFHPIPRPQCAFRSEFLDGPRP